VSFLHLIPFHLLTKNSSVNGYRPWLSEIFESCIDDHNSLPDVTNREVQFACTVQLPQKSDRRSKWVPWTFIADQMNLPEVYYWTANMRLPTDRDLQKSMYAPSQFHITTAHTLSVKEYRFRIGAWACGKGAYKGDPKTAVVILFTQPKPLCEYIVTTRLFAKLCEDAEYDSPRLDEEGLAWLFLHLYDLLTDWQNIIREVERRLEEAEKNSHGRNIPVKLRTREMHEEVGRIWELTEYLRFHRRSFNKLAKLKANVPVLEQKEPAWDQIDDAIDDLEQAGYYLDSLKERFNNLIELEFNIENANQSDNSRFLSILGTLFLPVSFLASIFGITSVNWPVRDYVYAAIPLFLLSLVFTFVFPVLVRRQQSYQYPKEKAHVPLRKQNYTLIGSDLPENANGVVPGDGSLVSDASPSSAPEMHRVFDDRRDPREVEAGYGSANEKGTAGRRRRRRRSRKRPEAVSDGSAYEYSPGSRAGRSRSRSRSRM